MANNESPFVEPLARAIRDKMIEIAERENHMNIHKSFQVLFSQAWRDVLDGHWEIVGEATQQLFADEEFENECP